MWNGHRYIFGIFLLLLLLCCLLIHCWYVPEQGQWNPSKGGGLALTTISTIQIVCLYPSSVLDKPKERKGRKRRNHTRFREDLVSLSRGYVSVTLAITARYIDEASG